MPSETKRRQLRARVIAGVVVLALVAAVWWLTWAMTGDNLAPSRSIGLRNDTGHALSWSCSWNDVDLAAGQTGSIRILIDPDQDFGCEVHHADNVYVCPAMQSLTTGTTYSAKDWLAHEQCG